MPVRLFPLYAVLLGLPILAGGPAPAGAVETAWVDGYNSKTRMIGGRLAGTNGSLRIVAGIEIKLASGWKTYWRAPGDSGGVPPSFAWTGSRNLASATVLYPAPRRLKDVLGYAVGYADSVVFPVLVAPHDENKPVELKLALEYGICREICVPAEAKVVLVIPVGSVSLPDALRAALDRVPREPAQRRPQDPAFKSGKAVLAGDKPHLVVEAEFGGGTAGADAYIEAPGSIYLSLPKPVRADGTSRIVFEVDLSGVEVKDLRGKVLRVTLVSNAGSSEAYWKID
ncbi:MAG: protein-disulfide reductase DsbD domain-containing protein [Hyphomicrobiaceae bacterium]